LEILARLSIAERASIDECYLDISEEAKKRLAASSAHPPLPINVDQVHVCGEASAPPFFYCEKAPLDRRSLLWAYLLLISSGGTSTRAQISGTKCTKHFFCADHVKLHAYPVQGMILSGPTLQRCQDRPSRKAVTGALLRRNVAWTGV
jgi:hypothetical protein